MTQSSADSIEAIARRLAQWIKYSWAGLGSGSIVDRGYPEWAGHAYQGGQDDLRRLAAELVALSAPAQAEAGMIRDALVAAQAHLLKYTGGFAANQEEASRFGKIAAALALSRPQSESK